jgi:hypothetical protein
MFVEVEYTGVTMGIVLQMTVDEVAWLVKTVEDVMTEVLVFVLVTRGGLVFYVCLLHNSWKVHSPT